MTAPEASASADNASVSSKSTAMEAPAALGVGSPRRGASSAAGASSAKRTRKPTQYIARFYPTEPDPKRRLAFSPGPPVRKLPFGADIGLRHHQLERVGLHPATLNARRDHHDCMTSMATAAFRADEDVVHKLALGLQYDPLMPIPETFFDNTGYATEMGNGVGVRRHLLVRLSAKMGKTKLPDWCQRILTDGAPAGIPLKAPALVCLAHALLRSSVPGYSSTNAHSEALFRLLPVFMEASASATAELQGSGAKLPTEVWTLREWLGLLSAGAADSPGAAAQARDADGDAADLQVTTVRQRHERYFKTVFGEDCLDREHELLCDQYITIPACEGKLWPYLLIPRRYLSREPLGVSKAEWADRLRIIMGPGTAAAAAAHAAAGEDTPHDAVKKTQQEYSPVETQAELFMDAVDKQPVELGTALCLCKFQLSAAVGILFPDPQYVRTFVDTTAGLGKIVLEAEHVSYIQLSSGTLLALTADTTQSAARVHERLGGNNPGHAFVTMNIGWTLAQDLKVGELAVASCIRKPAVTSSLVNWPKMQKETKLDSRAADALLHSGFCTSEPHLAWTECFAKLVKLRRKSIVVAALPHLPRNEAKIVKKLMARVPALELRDGLSRTHTFANRLHLVLLAESSEMLEQRAVDNESAHVFAEDQRMDVLVSFVRALVIFGLEQCLGVRAIDVDLSDLPAAPGGGHDAKVPVPGAAADLPADLPMDLPMDPDGHACLEPFL